MSDEAQEPHRAAHLSDEAQDQHRATHMAHASPEMKEHLKKMAEHIEKGDMEGIKMCHMAMCKMAEEQKKHMSGVDDVKSEDYKKSMEQLEGELDEVKTNLARMAGMVDELMSAEVKEGHDLESAPPEQGEPQPGVKA